MINEKKQKYRVPGLEKGLDILEELAISEVPLSLTELGRQLNRSGSELFRMLTVLEARDYINKDSQSGNYSLSLKLYELAHMHPPINHLLLAAAQPMEALTQSLRESCHLSVLRRGNLVVLKESLSPARVRLSVPVGGRFSPISTVSGRLLLAQLSADELNELLARNEEFIGLDEVAQQEILDKLAEAREVGVSTAVSETHMGVSDAAVLVGNPRVGLSAALAVASLRASAQPEYFRNIIDQLKQCAQTITQKMGLENDTDYLL